MARPSKRLAMLLCLIVLHQDFIQARSSYNEHLLMSARMIHEDMDDDVKEFGNAIQEVEAKHNITLRTGIGRPLIRGKRFFGLFIFIVSLIVTVVATVVETVYDIAGCCGLSFHYLCGFESEFNRRKNEVERRAGEVDKRLEQAIKRKDSLIGLGKTIENFWAGIARLVKLEEDLLTSTDATIKEIVLLKQKQTTDRIREGSGTLDEADFDVAFAKIGEVEQAIKLATSWGLLAIDGVSGISGKAFKAYKVNKAYKAMKSTQLEKLLKAAPKAQKLLGYTDDGAKLFLKATAIAKFAGKAKTAMKALKVFKVAGTVLSLVGIAFDIFTIVNTFVQCADKVKKAKESNARLKEAEDEVKKMEDSVARFENSLRIELEAHIQKEIKEKDMLNALGHIKETIQCNPPPNNQQPPRTWTAKCIRIIPEYINLFKTSKNWKDLGNKMKELIDDCLSKQEYVYECLIARNKMNDRIRRGCQNGAKTFDQLYADAQTSEIDTIDQCRVKGEPYTTKQMFMEALKERSKAQDLEFYTENCKMNNKIIQQGVCDGGSPAGLTPDQKEKVLQDKCEGGKAPKLNAEVVSDICIYKLASVSVDQIKTFLLAKAPDITVEDINGVTCPSLS
ncbi:uncharacterized protein LOC110252788 [Exaiptasia diaphana]|uniref:Uncharacterized protein n=1 Tax=Exaiptasia diaphana TaxID=2652724 RepID=A0A913Y7A9_EXADI|nr:uncharacterized protein LOC110252788 [Exaiptasia diaphana]KXJ22292.1 hypothetical protein AC249_AIPGENE21110 [Exaiptasia diaphana]